MKLVLTGATGFLGSALLKKIKNFDVFVIGRNNPKNCSEDRFYRASIEECTDYSTALVNANVLIHCAARAHVKKKYSNDSLIDYREVNTKGTLNLARQASDAGVKRFIYISSIGVLGSKNTKPFCFDSQLSPFDDYSISKFEAEEGLKKIAVDTGMELVIIRPPLVYGPNAPGSFGLLTKVVSKGFPLPLASICNQRSFVSIWNLVDLIITCIGHPKAAGESFLVCDGEDVSTSGLLQKIGMASGKPVRLFWCPKVLLKGGAILVGKQSIYDRLFDSLQVDDSYTRKTLDWEPPVSLDEALMRCFEHKKG